MWSKLSSLNGYTLYASCFYWPRFNILTTTGIHFKNNEIPQPFYDQILKNSWLYMLFLGIKNLKLKDVGFLFKFPETSVILQKAMIFSLPRECKYNFMTFPDCMNPRKQPLYSAWDLLLRSELTYSFSQPVLMLFSSTSIPMYVISRQIWPTWPYMHKSMATLAAESTLNKKVHLLFL